MPARVAGAAASVFLLAACAACGAVCGTVPAASVQKSTSVNLACVDVKAAHHAYVVVQHASGAWVDRCVGFAPQVIDAPTLMGRAGISFQAPQGLLCNVDGEPLERGSCAGGAAPMHWALFVASGRTWAGKRADEFAVVRLGDGQALGLRYVPATGTNAGPPPLPPELGG